LIRHFSLIELIEQPVYKHGLSVRGPKSLKLELRP